MPLNKIGQGGGINPETWPKEDVKRLRRKYNLRQGIKNPADNFPRLSADEKRKRALARKKKKREAKRSSDPMRPIIPKLPGPRIPIGSIIEAVKPYADFYEVDPYQLATDAARKIAYKHISLNQVLRVWDAASPQEKKKKLSLDWIVEYTTMERDEFKALILTVLRNEAVEKAQDLQIVNIAKLTEASINFARTGETQAASLERMRHLEKHRILDAPKAGGVVVNTNVNQQSAMLPSMDDWSRQLDTAMRGEQKALPEADLTNVIDAEVEIAEERESVPA
jgi:predicted HTH domain antitoxin